MESISFSDWAKQRLLDIEFENQVIPAGNPRENGYRRSFDMCKYHGVDLTKIAKAVKDGHIKGYTTGNQLWVDREEFREFIGL